MCSTEMRRRIWRLCLIKTNEINVLNMDFKMELYFFIFASCVPVLVYTQFGQSPCPNMFQYRAEGGQMYGWIELKPTGPVNSITLLVDFTVATKLGTSYVGRIEPVGSQLQLLQDFNQGRSIKYRIHLPVNSPLPRLTRITVDGNIVCQGPGDILIPGRYVTTIRLQHILYLKSDSFPVNENWVRPTKIDPVTNFQGTVTENKDSILYTFGDADFPDNRNGGGWNPGPEIFASNFSNPSSKPSDPQNSVYQIYPNVQSTPAEPQTIQQNTVYPTYQNFQPSGPRPTHPKPQQTQPGQQNQIYPNYQQPRPQSTKPRPIRPVQQDPIYPTYPNLQPPQPQPTQPELQPAQQNPVYPTYPNIEPSLPQPTQGAPQLVQRLPEQPSTQTEPAPTPSSQIQCGVVAGGNERVPLIFLGQSLTRGDWPWLVAIYKRKDGGLTFICSGTLVSDRHVVTAAHCVQQNSVHTATRDVVVKVGVFNLQDWGDDITETRTLIAAKIHESYNPKTLANDILVITLHRTVTFNNNIRPACLWDGNTDQSRIVGATGVVIGWGDSELGPGGYEEPRLVRMPVVSTATCRASRSDFHKLTSSTTLCAGDRNGAGPCLGDSGGGLYILDDGRWRLRGIVSLSLRADNGEKTCNLKEYIVFTDAAQYLSWIQSVTK